MPDPLPKGVGLLPLHENHLFPASVNMISNNFSVHILIHDSPGLKARPTSKHIDDSCRRNYY